MPVPRGDGLCHLPGQALVWPCLLTGVSAETPGSSATSRLRAPRHFAPVLIVLR
jgi:hypothetical protein